jgi:hypothetical protein
MPMWRAGSAPSDGSQFARLEWHFASSTVGLQHMVVSICLPHDHGDDLMDICGSANFIVVIAAQKRPIVNTQDRPKLMDCIGQRRTHQLADRHDHIGFARLQVKFLK